MHSSALLSGLYLLFFFSSSRRHTRFSRDWSSDVCSSDLAERLDISPPHASRLVRTLEERGLVARGGSPADQRATIVRATEAGVDLLRQIDAEVRLEVGHYQRQLRDADRFNALSIFALYVGLDISPE